MAPIPQHHTTTPARLLLPVLLTLLCGPWPALAQIPSPSNAGGNSGNNASGSSTTPFSTPTFSPTQTVPLLPDLSVDDDGTINAPQAIVSSVNAAVLGSISTPEGAILSGIVDGPAPSITATDLTNPEILPDVVLTSAAGQTQQTALSLLDQVARQYAAGTLGSSFAVSSASNGSQGTVTLGEGSMTVSTAGTQASFASTPATQLALAQFAALGIAAGLTAQSIAVGALLVSGGVTPLQTAQLMLSLQGLANATTLTPLSNGITTFNAIVNGTSESGLAALASNPAFIGIRTTLNTAREALAAAVVPAQ